MIRLALRCRRDEAEIVLAELLELAPAGVEEVHDPDGREGVVEYALYGAEGELPELGSLHAAAGGALVEIRSERVPADWRERWKRFHHPLLVAGRIYVRAPWDDPATRGGVVDVVIEPGRAFGTGSHATTAMCLELLAGERPWLGRLPLKRRRRSLCDVGCGSGVLAIAAARLGFRPVAALDSERAALEETERNARRNFVEVAAERHDLRQATAPVADLVTANLTTPLLERVADGWRATRERPGAVIASGFLATEADAIASAFAAAGLQERHRLARGDWGALVAWGTSS